VAGVALAALGWLWRAWARWVARGAAPLCVAGVPLGDIHLGFAWQAWHLRHWVGSGGALGRAQSPAATCVAGVALGDIHPRGTWDTGLALVARLGALGRPGRHATLRGRRGTW